MVTGGAGFIGSHLVERLLEDGHNVICYDNLDDWYSGKRSNVERALENPRFEVRENSILDIDALKSALEGVEVVFHEAAQPGIPVSVKNPLKTFTVNVNGTLNVLLASLDTGVKKVVYASSSSVYGNGVPRPTPEDCETRPISPYGISKLVTEGLCEAIGEMHGLRTIGMRYFTVFGPRQRPDMAIRKFAGLMSSGKPVVIFGDGDQTRDFTFVSDVVDANVRAMESSGADGEILNIGRGSSVTVNEVVSKMKEHFPDAPEPIHEAAKEEDVDHTLADNSKARNLLGWEPKVSFDDGLGTFVNWFRSSTEPS
jgi:UDP-glucose 4-epimerase